MKKHFTRIVLLAISSLFLNTTIQAQKDSVLTSCLDAVVTCYGADTSSPTAGVKQLGNPLGSGGVLGKHWDVSMFSPNIMSSWTMGKMGQVFGTAIDDIGNVYFASTAMYWEVNTLSYMTPIRLAIPNPGIYLAGGPGYHASGGPSAVYQASATNLHNVTPIITSSASPASYGVGTNVLKDHGYGLGNIAAFDDYLYVVQLDNGTIYKYNTTTSLIEDEFDPFGVDSSGSNIAPYGQRLFAVAVNREPNGDNRLYYSVQIDSNYNEIWSVKLAANGNFDAAANELEIQLPVKPVPTNSNSFWNRAAHYISDIAFSTRGEMLIAEKSHPHAAYVYQVRGRHKAWSKLYKIPAGNKWSSFNNERAHSAGGVDYATIVDSSGQKAVCDSLIWMQVNNLRNNNSERIYGLVSLPHTGFVGDPNVANVIFDESYYIDLDNKIGVHDAQKGQFGDVEFFGKCCPAKATDLCDSLYVSVQPMDSCCYQFNTYNGFDSTYFSQVIITSSNGYTMHTVTNTSNWAAISYQDPSTVIMDGGATNNMPMGGQPLAEICVSGNGPGMLTFYFIGNGPQHDTVCVVEREVQCGNSPQLECLDVQQELTCDQGNYLLTFTLTNLSNFTMRGVTLYPLSAGISTDTPYSNIFVPIADLLPGDTATYSVPISIHDTVSQACFYYAPCDINTRPFVSGVTPDICCMDSVQYCSKVPDCDPCDGLVIGVLDQDSTSDDCCFQLNLTNNLSSQNISCIEFVGVGGAQFALFGTQWNIQGPVSSGYVKLCAPGGSVPVGTIDSFAQLCLTGTSIAPHTIMVNYLDGQGDLVCAQELEFPDCDLVQSSCLQIVNDTLYCEGDKHVFKFDVLNNSPFDVYQLDVRASDSSVVTSPWFFQLDTPIAPGATQGTFEVIIDSARADLDFLCLYLSAHNAAYDSVTGQGASLCCTDSLGGICLPFIDCDSISLCCDVRNFVIPSGLTPNQDNHNDKLVIKNADACKKVKIIVYNRWGNIVYQNDDYKNDWQGQGNGGTLLPQGTYYILLEGDNGNKKGIYLDLRY